MAFATHPNYLEIVRAPGYLYSSPTNLALESGWGDLLGFTEKGIEIDPGYRAGVLAGEERGEEPLIKRALGYNPRITVVLKNYNSVALSALFPGCIASGNIRYPNDFKAGSDLLQLATHLLFVPRDRTNNPVVLFQKAAGNIVRTMRMSQQSDTVFPAVFDAFRKTSDPDGIFFQGPITSAVLR